MIKKLRFKFISINMGLIFTVLLITIIALSYTSYRTLVNDVMKSLRQGIERQIGTETNPTLTSSDTNHVSSEADSSSNSIKPDSSENDSGSNSIKPDSSEPDNGSNSIKPDSSKSDNGSNSTKPDSSKSDNGSNSTKPDSSEADNGSNSTKPDSSKSDNGSNSIKTDSSEADIDSNNTNPSYEPKSYGDITYNDSPPSIGTKNMHDEHKATASVIVKLNNSNVIEAVIQNNASMTTEVLDKAVEYVANSKDTKGKISSLDLFYYTKASSNARYIAFADSSSTEHSVITGITVYSLVLVASLILFFFISLFLSNFAVKPVETAWKKQQQFIADASHELKTPLTVILANNNILLSHMNDTISSQKKWLINTQDEAIHMKNLVEDLLYLARSDAKITPIELTQFSLSDLAWSCSLQFEPVAFEKCITLNTNIEPDINILGDSVKIKQLIHILLDNSCKYCISGGTVNLTLAKHQHNAILSVNNNGPIIPAEDIDHIFERFYRSDKSRKREGGFGLGLSIAKSICDEHKASLTVESNEQSGTTFWFKIDTNIKRNKTK